MVMKKHLTPLSKGGAIMKHAGKGSQQQIAPGAGGSTPLQTLTGGSPLNRSMNDYTKATPMANPVAGSPGQMDQGTPDLGSGTWGGNGV